MAYLSELDTQKLNDLMLDTSQNVQYFEQVTSNVVLEYTQHLDEVMTRIYNEVIAIDEVPDSIIEKYFLELTNCIYFVASNLEKLGIYDSMSKAAYKEAFNKAYLNNQVKDVEKKNKTTVAENTAIAENSSLYESSVNDIYNKAYKIVKNKIDNAQLMVHTLSKVMSKRIQEYSLTNLTNTQGKRILNEGWPNQNNYNTYKERGYTEV